MNNLLIGTALTAALLGGGYAIYSVTNPGNTTQPVYSEDRGPRYTTQPVISEDGQIGTPLYRDPGHTTQPVTSEDDRAELDRAISIHTPRAETRVYTDDYADANGVTRVSIPTNDPVRPPGARPRAGDSNTAGNHNSDLSGDPQPNPYPYDPTDPGAGVPPREPHTNPVEPRFSELSVSGGAKLQGVEDR